MPERQREKTGQQGQGIEGVPHQYRITVSVGPDAEGDDRNVRRGRIERLSEEIKATPVRWLGDSKTYASLNQKHGLSGDYVISAVDSTNKSSIGYGPCIGIVAAGRSNDGLDKNISLLVHAIPNLISSYSFVKDLTGRLAELKAQSEEDTTDVVIFGGNAENKYNNPDPYYRNQHLESLAELVRLVRFVLSVDPRVFDPATGGFTDVVFENDQRRLHMTREAHQKIPETLEQSGSEILKKVL